MEKKNWKKDYKKEFEYLDKYLKLNKGTYPSGEVMRLVLIEEYTRQNYYLIIKKHKNG